MVDRSARALALYATLTESANAGTDSASAGAKAREAGLEVLGDPELREDAELMLAALRTLIHAEDPDVFRALLPFAAHRWAGGWLPFEASPCPQRGALLAEWLEATLPNTVAEPLIWPRLPIDDPAAAAAIPEDLHGPEMVVTMVSRLWPTLGAEDRVRLHATARVLDERAASVRAREDAARLRVAIGDTEPVAELRESAIDRLREFAVAAWLALDVEAVIVELGPLLADGPRQPGDAERLASLERILDRAEHHAVALDPRTGLIVYCEIGPDQRWQLGRWRPATGEWVDRASIEVPVEFGPARRPRLRFAKSAKAGAFVLEYEDRGGERLRHHVRPDHAGPWRHGSRASDLAAAQPNPAGPAKPARPAQPAPPEQPVKRAPSKPARYAIRRVGRGPSAHEGRLATPGDHWVGVYDTQQDAIILAPPHAVAIALAGEHAVVWTSRRRPDRSGVARADHDWIIEIWSLTGEGPLASHTVADRELIGWCWPDGITCAARTRHRIVRLSCRSEDDRVDLYLARQADGGWLETRERAVALAAIRSQPGERPD